MGLSLILLFLSNLPEFLSACPASLCGDYPRVYFFQKLLFSGRRRSTPSPGEFGGEGNAHLGFDGEGQEVESLRLGSRERGRG